MLGVLCEKLTVSFLDSSQINDVTFPEILEEGNAIPNLLFLNLDGAATLLRSHLARLQSLASRNILKRVYLDESQQLLVEYGFRHSYQALQELGRIGAPVMCLSGSLPCSMAMSLMGFCGLNQSSNNELVDIVMPSDPIACGFSFRVDVVNDIANAVSDYVLKSRVGACHVLCSSVSLVQTVSSRLSEQLKVLSITGDSTYQEQIGCAKSWYQGDYDVLVSTVVALVGNENRLCKTIVVGGFLFNVSSLVQAIGRLRPEQRGPDSSVQVFHSPFRSKETENARKKSLDLFTELQEAGCLKADSKEQFMKLFAPVGLQDVLSLKDGCFLQQMSMFYDFPRLPCERCGLCTKRLFALSSRDDTMMIPLGPPSILRAPNDVELLSPAPTIENPAPMVVELIVDESLQQPSQTPTGGTRQCTRWQTELGGKE